MRKRYSFSCRKTGQAKDPKNIRKQRPTFPEVVVKVLNDSDIILEVLDSRFISDTQNPELEAEIKRKNKKIIYVINKSDLGLAKQKILIKPHVIVSCRERKGIKALRDKIKFTAKLFSKERTTVGVIGYPNTGKSSLINLLIGKKSAPSSSQAGYTKGVQKLKLAPNIMLLDSPGVIPKEEYTTIKSRKLAKHAKIGAKTYTQVKDPEAIIAEFIKEFPGTLEKYYNITTKGNSEYLIEKLGRKLHYLKKGNQVNYDRVSREILKDWQQGKIKI